MNLRDRRWYVLMLMVSVIVIMAGISYLLFSPFELGNRDTFVYRLIDWYRSLGMAGVGLSAGVMIASALTILPAEAPGIANGAVYGAGWGAALSWVRGMG